MLSGIIFHKTVPSPLPEEQTFTYSAKAVIGIEQNTFIFADAGENMTEVRIRPVHQVKYLQNNLEIGNNSHKVYHHLGLHKQLIIMRN